MEEIKVGEYVRTVKGEIGKYTIIEGLYCIETAGGYFNNIGITIGDIKSHSKNIIDLIQEGDYVNGKCVYSVGTSIGNFPVINFKDGTFDIDTNIKSIVTREQFDSVEYKVGGENERN